MNPIEKTFLVSLAFITANLFGYGQRQEPMASPLVEKPSITVAPSPTIAPAPTSATKTADWQGLASYYSRAGCLGCSSTLTMANGQPLDDGALTIAFNRAKLGTRVSVTNTKTGKSTIATVTDTGGFERHGKIADLTIATRDAIGCGSTCTVTIKLE
jgi:rare lipoprotein A (peptidoglycan hydrolase)